MNKLAANQTRRHALTALLCIPSVVKWHVAMVAEGSTRLLKDQLKQGGISKLWMMSLTWNKLNQFSKN